MRRRQGGGGRAVRVSVPASSGNLGPGFDVLGLALNLRNDLEIRVLDARPGRPVIEVSGEGKDVLPADGRNAVYRTIRRVFARAGRRLPRLALRCVNRIPVSRGLGSSAAATLSGLLGANRLLGDPFSSSAILDWATALEGHPDNAAAALFGGVWASGVFHGAVVSAPLPVPKLALVAAVPGFSLATRRAREVLPSRVPLRDAVANLSAVALLPAAFAKDPGLLRHVLNDRLHEPYRARLVPGFARVKTAALKSGAAGVILSGAGPTMLAFAPAAKAGSVAAAMTAAFRRSGVRCRAMKLKVETRGSLVR